MKKYVIIGEKSNGFLLNPFDEQFYRITDDDFKKIKELYQEFRDKSCEDLIKATSILCKNSKLIII
jgi:hypothetical protein